MLGLPEQLGLHHHAAQCAEDNFKPFFWVQETEDCRYPPFYLLSQR